MAADLVMQLPNVVLSDAGWSVQHSFLCKTSLAGLRRLIVAPSYFHAIQISSRQWNQANILWTRRCISRSCFKTSGICSYVHDVLASLYYCRCSITSFWVPRIYSHALGYGEIPKNLSERTGSLFGTHPTRTEFNILSAQFQ